MAARPGSPPAIEESAFGEADIEATDEGRAELYRIYKDMGGAPDGELEKLLDHLDEADTQASVVPNGHADPGETEDE